MGDEQVHLRREQAHEISFLFAIEPPHTSHSTPSLLISALSPVRSHVALQSSLTDAPGDKGSCGRSLSERRSEGGRNTGAGRSGERIKTCDPQPKVNTERTNAQRRRAHLSLYAPRSNLRLVAAQLELDTRHRRPNAPLLLHPLILLHPRRRQPLKVPHHRRRQRRQEERVSLARNRRDSKGNAEKVQTTLQDRSVEDEGAKSVQVDVLAHPVEQDRVPPRRASNDAFAEEAEFAVARVLDDEGRVAEHGLEEEGVEGLVEDGRGGEDESRRRARGGEEDDGKVFVRRVVRKGREVEGGLSVEGEEGEAEAGGGGRVVEREERILVRGTGGCGRDGEEGEPRDEGGGQVLCMRVVSASCARVQKGRTRWVKERGTPSETTVRAMSVGWDSTTARA